jgi:GrpB-like predicted nucleotidyltransferase (UPF0157 family)
VTVTVVPYDEEWPVLFAAEADQLRRAIGKPLRAVEHVGSTAVPGLAAKPIVDIAISVEDFDALDIPMLEALGYRYVPEYEDELPQRRYFEKAGFHVHVYELEHEEFMDYLRFRDYLRTHPEDAGAYGELKLRLAVEDREAYQEGKGPFVARLVAALRRG